YALKLSLYIGEGIVWCLVVQKVFVSWLSVRNGRQNLLYRGWKLQAKFLIIHLYSPQKILCTRMMVKTTFDAQNDVWNSRFHRLRYLKFFPFVYSFASLQICQNRQV